MRSPSKIALYCGFVGVSIALLFFLFFISIDRLSPSAFLNQVRGFAEDIVLLVWPASFWLMATQGAGVVSTIEIVLLALFANFALYFLLGLTLIVLHRAWMRSGAKSN